MTLGASGKDDPDVRTGKPMRVEAVKVATQRTDTTNLGIAEVSQLIESVRARRSQVYTGILYENKRARGFGLNHCGAVIGYKGLLAKDPDELRLPTNRTITERSYTPFTKRLIMNGTFKSAKTGLIIDDQTKVIEHIN